MSTEPITARTLMRTDVDRIEVGRPLFEAMEALARAAGDEHAPRVLLAVDGEGRHEGVLTAKLLLRSLLALWSPERAVRDDAALHDDSLLALVEERRTMPVRDALIRGLPAAAPDARILSLIRHVTDGELEYLPVVERGRAIGIVPVTDILFVTAGLVLTPDDEGIRFD